MLRYFMILFLIAQTALSGTNITFNNSPYTIPAAGELNWQALSSFLVDVGQHAQTTTFQKIGARIATTTPVTVNSTDSVVITNLAIAGAVTVNLPAGSDGRAFYIVDGKGDAATNNVTIDANGAETINGSLTYVMDHDREGVVMVYQTSGWFVVANVVDGLVNADISATAAIARTKLASGTADHVLINNGSGVMSSEARLALTRGGTNKSITASAGAVAYTDADSFELATAGSSTELLHGGTTPSFSSVVSADITDGTIANADIAAAAAIARTKLASGTADSVLINDGSGVVSSETRLALTRGGTNKSITPSAGAVTYTDADSFELLAAGTSTQVLHSGTTPSFSAVSLTADVSGTLPIANGGTNSTATPTTGGVGYGTGTAHAYTAAGTTTQVLHGSATAPTFGAVSLTADVSGTLPIANGGTNSTATATNGGIAYGTGTALAFTAALTSARLIQSNGAAAPTTASAVSTDQSIAASNSIGVKTADFGVNTAVTATEFFKTGDGTAGKPGTVLFEGSAGTGQDAGVISMQDENDVEMGRITTHINNNANDRAEMQFAVNDDNSAGGSAVTALTLGDRGSILMGPNTTGNTTAFFNLKTLNNSTTCNTTCAASEPGDVSSASGICMSGWNATTLAPLSTTPALSCSDNTAATTRLCLCMGIM